MFSKFYEINYEFVCKNWTNSKIISKLNFFLSGPCNQLLENTWKILKKTENKMMFDAFIALRSCENDEILEPEELNVTKIFQLSLT